MGRMCAVCEAQRALQVSTWEERGRRQMLAAHSRGEMRTRGQAGSLRADSSTEKDHISSLGYGAGAPLGSFRNIPRSTEEP